MLANITNQLPGSPAGGAAAARRPTAANGSSGAAGGTSRKRRAACGQAAPRTPPGPAAATPATKQPRLHTQPCIHGTLPPAAAAAGAGAAAAGAQAGAEPRHTTAGGAPPAAPSTCGCRAPADNPHGLEGHGLERAAAAVGGGAAPPAAAGCGAGRRDAAAAAARSTAPAAAAAAAGGSRGPGATVAAATSAAAAALPGSGSGRVQVCVRVRQLAAQEAAACTPAPAAVTVAGPQELRLALADGAKPDRGGQHRTFAFDQVLGPECGQEGVYSAIGERVLGSVLAGYNTTVFAYGQTGSGKTHTMMGDVSCAGHPDAGLGPRLFEGLFRHLHAAPAPFVCRLSLLEVYNNQVTDLLRPAAKNLQVTCTGKQGTVVAGLSEHGVRSAADVLAMMQQGSRNRSTAETLMNKASSRSHSVLTLTLEAEVPAAGAGAEAAAAGGSGRRQLRVAVLRLVDLAGSENVDKSGVSGEQLTEAGHINTSLTVLGKVIRQLVRGKGHKPPYRESRLTFLLQESLGGNSKTWFIANISPAGGSAAESSRTLSFVAGVKRLRVNAVVNTFSSATLDALHAEVRRLQERLGELEAARAAEAEARARAQERQAAAERAAAEAEQQAAAAVAQAERAETRAQLAELRAQKAAAEAEQQAAAVGAQAEAQVERQRAAAQQAAEAAVRAQQQLQVQLERVRSDWTGLAEQVEGLREAEQQLRESILCRDAQLAEAKKAAQQLQERISCRDAQLAEAKEAAQQLRESISCRDAQLAEAKEAAQQLQESIACRDAQLAEAKAAEQQLRETILRQAAQLWAAKQHAGAEGVASLALKGREDRMAPSAAPIDDDSGNGEAEMAAADMVAEVAGSSALQHRLGEQQALQEAAAQEARAREAQPQQAVAQAPAQHAQLQEQVRKLQEAAVQAQAREAQLQEQVQQLQEAVQQLQEQVPQPQEPVQQQQQHEEAADAASLGPHDPAAAAAPSGASDQLRALGLAGEEDNCERASLVRLHRAAMHADYAAMRELLGRGVDANVRSEGAGLTPLHCAVLSAVEGAPLLRVLHLLDSKRADPNAASVTGFTPLLMCLLNTSGVNKTALKWLLDPGRRRLDLNKRCTADGRIHGGHYSQQGWSALHVAASRGEINHVKDLLAAGADPEARDNERNLPLHVAAAAGRVGVVRLLLSLHVPQKLLAQNVHGSTPLHLAAGGCGPWPGPHLPVVRVLVEQFNRVRAEQPELPDPRTVRDIANGATPLELCVAACEDSAKARLHKSALKGLLAAA